MLRTILGTLENFRFLPLIGLVTSVSFSTTSKVLQNPNHRLYPLIDWDKVSGGNYAVVDPADTAAILYLSERDYKIQLRVSLSSDSPLVVLARAGEVPLTQESKESPISSGSTSTSNDPTTKKSPPKGDSSEPTSWSEALREKAKVKHYMGKLIFWAKSGFSPYVKPGRQGEETLVTVDKGNFSTLFTKWALLSLHWTGKGPVSSATRADISSMANYLLGILEHQGASTMIKHMKLTSVAIRRFLAGNPVKDSWELDMPIKVCTNGLPAWLPVRIRRAISSESILVLRWIFTVLNQYKGFKCSYKSMDLSNIVAPHPEFTSGLYQEFQEWSATRWKRLVEKVILDSDKSNLIDKEFLVDNNSSDEPFMPLTAGPNCSVSLLGSPLDTYAWGLSSTNWLLEYLKTVNDQRTLQLYHMVAGAVASAYPKVGRASIIPDRRETKPSSVPTSHLRELSLGKLAIRCEAAGKKRIFAIPDYWTQRALRPLHNWMMDVLSVFPSDATFDQNGAVTLFAGMQKDAAHSYDLKAATDTIPQALYEIVLKAMLPAHLVDVWMMLLTDRWFKVPPKEKLNVSYVQYSRGQPMGALSSWPSMAIVHHAIVQFSAFKAGRLDSQMQEFWAYRILGDDVVIGDGEVGRVYVAVCEALNVKIGRKVSLVSDASVNSVRADHKVTALSIWQGTANILKGMVTYTKAAKRAARGHFFEFANQFWLGNVNVSPLSFKEEIGITSTAQRLEFAVKAFTRWPPVKGQSWVARLVRYLLPQTEYVNSAKAWQKGQLGAGCQAALIVAFGPIRDMMSRLGFQWSSIRPLLLAYANSSALIGGDQRILQAELGLRDRELVDALTLRFLTLFQARVRKMMGANDRAKRDFIPGIKSLVEAPCSLRVDGTQGGGRRPSWVLESAPAYLVPVLFDHLGLSELNEIGFEEQQDLLEFLPDMCPTLEQHGMLLEDFMFWSYGGQVFRRPPMLSEFAKVSVQTTMTPVPATGDRGGCGSVIEADAVQTALVLYTEGGALIPMGLHEWAPSPFSQSGENLRDPWDVRDVIPLPPPTDDPLFEVWLKGEEYMPPLHNEADFSELCERFANLLPPTILSVDTLLEQRERPLRSRHARELEAIGRAVRAIVPLFEQLAVHSSLAGTEQGGEPLDVIAETGQPDVLTKKPLR